MSLRPNARRASILQGLDRQDTYKTIAARAGASLNTIGATRTLLNHGRHYCIDCGILMREFVAEKQCECGWYHMPDDSCVDKPACNVPHWVCQTCLDKYDRYITVLSDREGR